MNRLNMLIMLDVRGKVVRVVQVLTILKWLSSLLFSCRVREIWPGPGSLCFVVAGICSFLAALILLGLDSLDEKERCHAPAKIAMQDMRDCFLCAALHEKRAVQRSFVPVLGIHLLHRHAHSLFLLTRLTIRRQIWKRAAINMMLSSP